MTALQGGIHHLVEARLRNVIDPCSVGSGNPMNIVEMGLVNSIDVHDGTVRIELRLTSPTCMMLEHFVTESRRLIATIPGVERVDVHGDQGLDWTPDLLHPDASRRRQAHLQRLR